MPEPISFTYPSVPTPLYWKAAQVMAKTETDRDGQQFLWTVVGWIVIVGVTVLLLRTDIVSGGNVSFSLGFVMCWLAMVFFSRLQQFRMSSLVDTEQERRGPTDAVFSDDGFVFRSSFGEIRLHWCAVDDVVDLGKGTGIRSGLLMYPLSDDALPPGLTPDAFRAALRAWANLD